MHLRWHADQLIAVGAFHQLPERVLDLRPLSCCRYNELNKRSRLETNPAEIGLIGADIHYPCNHPSFPAEYRCPPPRRLKDEGGDSTIPLRTGCDAAALSIVNQMAAGDRMDRCAPDSLFEQRAKCGKSRIGG
jgi:hypothetical protein